MPKSPFHFLFGNCFGSIGCCDGTVEWLFTALSHCLEHLRAMQALAFAGANLASLPNKKALTQLDEHLSGFIFRSEEFLNIALNETSKSEIRNIMHTLADILSNPSSLTHICRIQIRRSLGRNFRLKLPRLRVPLTLQDYLMIYKDTDTLL